MKRLLLVIVLAAAVAFAVWFGMRANIRTASSSATVAALLPKETVALLHLPDLNRSREQWHQTDLYKLWREPALQDFLQKPLAKIPSNAGVHENLQQVEQLGVRDAFVALTSWEGDQPQFAGGFRFKGSAADAEKIIGKWRARVTEGTTPTTVEYQSHQLQVMTRGTLTFATVYDGDWFLAANNVELVKALLDRVDGRAKDAATTLGGDGTYAAAFKHMPMGYAAFAYARLDGYFEKLAARNQGAVNQTQWETLRKIRSVAASSSFDNGKFRDVLFVGMPKRDTPAELTRNSLALATADSFLYVASLLNLPHEMTLPDPAGAVATGWLARFGQKLGALGAKGFTLDDFTSAFALEGSVIGDWSATTKIPALLFSLPVRDVEKANRIVAAFTAVADEDQQWMQSPSDGVQYYTLPPANPMIPLAPTIAVGKELLVAGLDRLSVEAAVKRGSGSEAARLADAPVFKAGSALVPKPTQAFTFVDAALLYSRLDAALRPMLIMGAAFVPGIADAVDLGKLPAPEVVTKHLSPIVMSQTYQDDGYVSESVGPVSIYQAAIGILGASGAATGFYQKQAGASGNPNPPAPFANPAGPSPTASPEEDEDDAE
ncbi:MAG: hypothetical protein ABR526_08020 [Chthoniobacterales bacterium]